MFSRFVGERRGGGDYKNITFPYGKNLATRGHLCYNLGKEKGCVNLKHNSLIVIKVGSSSLTKRGGTLDTERLECLVSQMVRAKEEGHQIVLVTSGAIAAGFRALGFSSRPTTIRDKQASASVGQALLMEEYRRAFAQYGIACGRVRTLPTAAASVMPTPPCRCCWTAARCRLSTKTIRLRWRS